MEKSGTVTANPIPIIVLSGFLGSGKTTLLVRILKHMKERGLTPAVVMNEIGEVSLDGIQVPEDVPMTEIMDGCICCSVRGELSSSVKLLVENNSPNGIIVEATGLAHPSEIIEALTDTSLVSNTEVKSVVTVIGADFFYEMMKEEGEGASAQTRALLLDQVCSSDTLILNRTDRLSADKLMLVREQLGQWNKRARLYTTQFSEMDVDELFHPDTEFDSSGCKHSPGLQSNEEPRNLHDHVTVYTQRVSGPVQEEKFMQFISRLPQEVYRAKGIITFDDSPHVQQLFQYAYREASLMELRTPKKMDDVLVIMGEGISRSRLKQLLNQLEGKLPSAVKLQGQHSARKTVKVKSNPKII